MEQVTLYFSVQALENQISILSLNKIKMKISSLEFVSVFVAAPVHLFDGNRAKVLLIVIAPSDTFILIT